MLHKLSVPSYGENNICVFLHRASDLVYRITLQVGIAKRWGDGERFNNERLEGSRITAGKYIYLQSFPVQFAF